MSNVLNQLAKELGSGSLEVVDLTRPLDAATPVIKLPPEFAASPGFTRQEISHYDDRGPAWYWNTIRLGEHTGTHFDAPIHWVTGKNLSNSTCDSIPPQRFIGAACVIDVSDKVSDDPDFLLEPSDISAWEESHGDIPAGSWVLMRTDWSKRHDPDEFLNDGEDGPHTPGLTRQAVEMLAHSRDVMGVGVETIGTDAGQAGGFDPPFPCHHVMLGAGKYGLASLCNLDRLPATGALLIAAPLKIVEGSGSPVRALAIVPGVSNK